MLCIIINHTSSYIVLLYLVQFLIDESVTSPFFSLMYCTVTFTTHYLFFYSSFLNSFSVFSSYSSNSSHSLSLHPLLSEFFLCILLLFFLFFLFFISPPSPLLCNRMSLRAAKAHADGLYKDEIVPVDGSGERDIEER